MTEATVTPANKTIGRGLALLLAAVALTISLLVAIASAQSGPADPAGPAPVTTTSLTAQPPLADCRVPPAVVQAEGMGPADCAHPRTTRAPWDRIR